VLVAAAVATTRGHSVQVIGDPAHGKALFTLKAAGATGHFVAAFVFLSTR
jgi:hypothetical protein